MGYIIRQNKAISINIMINLIESFKRDIGKSAQRSWERQQLCMGMAYAIICFCASLRGNEGMKLDIVLMRKYWNMGLEEDKRCMIPPHVTIPLRGRFKGEQGERCHLLPLANQTRSGIQIRWSMQMLLEARK